MNSTVRWIALALLGIAIAAGVSIAASRLASQQIGLASQPISAGDALVPHVSPGARKKHPHPATSSTTTTTTTAPTTTPTSPTIPISPGPSGGGEGDGGGGGGGSDD